MGVNRVEFEMMWESLKEKFVENAALVDGQVVCHLRVSPVCQVGGVVVDGVEPISSNESHCVGKNALTDSVGWADAYTGIHRLLRLFADKARVKFDEIGVIK